MLYPTRGEVPEEEYLIPLGQADIKRAGSDVTIVSYSRTVLFALSAAERLAAEGISAEVIDLRTLVPLDKATILESVRKTNRLVVAHEAHRTAGFGAEIAALVQEEALDYLDAPIARVAARDLPIPVSPVLENHVLPQEDDIVAAARRVVRGK